jgi:cell division protein FtsI/penicillin-binding protein 2
MQTYPQQDIIRRRLPFVIVALLSVSGILLLRLISFQFPLEPQVESYLTNLRDSGYGYTLSLAGARGNIYDRHGETMAVNTLEYRIGVSPSLVADARLTATQLSTILGLSELEIYENITNSNNSLWVLIAPRVSAELAQRVRQLGLPEIRMESVPRRSYPQGAVAAQVIGFVGGDLRGYYGIEGNYNDQLAGEVYESNVSSIPFIVPITDWEQERGRDVVLTIDRDVQFVAESELLDAINRYEAQSGSVIIMNPRNGDVLAMASYPSFDPNTYFNIEDESLLSNPAISEQFEPGSIFKIIVMAAALETGTITPDWGYNDLGSIDVGGITIRNWDRRSYGYVNATQVLVNSLNVGMATISTSMGTTNFYTMLDKFGIGRATGIDLEGEQAGTLYAPGDENWSESQLGTNSFGQGVALTPLQMITAASAIANDGLMMQPRVVHEIIDGNERIEGRPSNLGRPISAETAHAVRDMMVAAVNEGLDGRATVPGYTIAGKTGTAEVPTPIGYMEGQSIASFIGFFPADDPQVIVLVKLDSPTAYWGAETAAPAFQRLAERLMILLEIPTDALRQQLADAGGAVNFISR